MTNAPVARRTLAACVLAVGVGAGYHPPGTSPFIGAATGKEVLACNPDEHMNNEEMTIQETTQPTISGHLVGVSNIWERDLPDSQGVIASRLSATVTIRDLTSQQSRVEKVFAGSVLSLGADDYCVVSVKPGKSAPGAITLRKMG
jgi:hypothetical protein